MEDKLLELRNIKTSFKIAGKDYAAVDDVSLFVKKGEVLAIVGESGCGKSALAFSIMALHSRAKVEGEILFKGEDINAASPKRLTQLRGASLGMIFQDSLSALNPLMTIKDQIEEAIFLHNRKTPKKQRDEQVLELLEKVGIPAPEKVCRQYPHQLSGGMRQRVVIAMAIVNKPKLIIADEPTTALDVTIQAQILDLLRELKDDLGAGIILITHDLGVVAEMADRVAVMYAGQIVEVADVYTLMKDPRHPYTRSLLGSMPSEVRKGQDLHVIEGIVPSLSKLPRKGCRFGRRISWLGPEHHQEDPELTEIQPGHLVRCTCHQHFYLPQTKEAGSL